MRKHMFLMAAAILFTALSCSKQPVDDLQTAGKVNTLTATLAN